jgi:flagellar biogenesis protein FliO
MLDISQPISLTFVFSTVGAIFAIIGLCVYLVNQKTKRLKDKK